MSPLLNKFSFEKLWIKWICIYDNRVSGILNNILKQEYIALVAHVVGYILCNSKYGLGRLDIHEQNIFIKSIIHY